MWGLTTGGQTRACKREKETTADRITRKRVCFFSTGSTCSENGGQVPLPRGAALQTSGSFQIPMNHCGVEEIPDADGKWQDAEGGCDKGLRFFDDASNHGEHDHEAQPAAN